MPCRRSGRFGLRNPWRCSFDMGEDRQLFCGDVQQNSFEEISIVAKGGNYGWRKMEGDKCFDYVNPNDHPATCDKNGLTDPILVYNNCTKKPQGCLGISVTGGHVYRGSHAPWAGKYIFGDWSKSFASMDGQSTRHEGGRRQVDAGKGNGSRYGDPALHARLREDEPATSTR